MSQSESVMLMYEGLLDHFADLAVTSKGELTPEVLDEHFGAWMAGVVLFVATICDDSGFKREFFVDMLYAVVDNPEPVKIH